MTTNQVSITESKFTETALYVSAICGKTSAIVVINDWEVRVIIQNAMHKAYKGHGKAFRTVAEAIANYKKDDVKAIIQAADELNR